MLQANLQTPVDLPQDLTCIPEPQYLPAPSAPLDFVEVGLSLSSWTQESRYVRTPRSFLSILASLALPIPPSMCHPILYTQAVPSLSLLSFQGLCIQIDQHTPILLSEQPESPRTWPPASCPSDLPTLPPHRRSS